MSLMKKGTSESCIVAYLVENLNMSEADALNLINSINCEKNEPTSKSSSNSSNLLGLLLGLLLTLWGVYSLVSDCHIFFYGALMSGPFIFFRSL